MKIVYRLTNLELSQEDGGVGGTLRLVGLLEQGSCSASVTKAVGHFLRMMIDGKQMSRDIIYYRCLRLNKTQQNNRPSNSRWTRGQTEVTDETAWTYLVL